MKDTKGYDKKTPNFVSVGIFVVKENQYEIGAHQATFCTRPE